MEGKCSPRVPAAVARTAEFNLLPPAAAAETSAAKPSGISISLGRVATHADHSEAEGSAMSSYSTRPTSPGAFLALNCPRLAQIGRGERMTAESAEDAGVDALDLAAEQAAADAARPDSQRK